VDPGQLADKAVSILTALALNASSGLYNGLVQAGGTRLYQVIEQRIQAGDSSAWGLLLRLRGEPQNQQVANWLATSLATLAATDEGFARELEEAIQKIETSSPPGQISGVYAGRNMRIGRRAVVSTGPTSIQNTNVRRTRISLGLGGIAVISAGILFLFLFGDDLSRVPGLSFIPSPFEPKVILQDADGWRYEASAAKVGRSPQLEGSSPARPGYEYLYVDIRVRSLQTDRNAPAVNFSFARPESQIGQDCERPPRDMGLFHRIEIAGA
jgi:hypothetical protein